MPGPLPSRPRILALERSRQLNPPRTSRDVSLVLVADRLEVSRKRRAHRDGEYCHPILVALPTPHEDLTTWEVHVLDPKLAALLDAQARTIEHPAHQLRHAVEPGQYGGIRHA